MRLLVPLLFPVFVTFSLMAAPVEAPAVKAPKPSPDSPERIEMTKVQIFLDRAGFRPGKIDGLGGEFTQRAADRWCDYRGVPRGSRIDLAGVGAPYRTHTVGEEDARWVGPTASQPSQQAKLKALLYGSLWEALAERFHCDLNFLKELNPEIAEPAVGMVLRVPDVEEFRMDDVKALQKARAIGTALPSPTPAPAPLATPPPDNSLPVVTEAAFFASGDSVSPAAPTLTPSATPAPAPTASRRLVLLRDERLIELYENDRIAGCFPCTPGSSKFPVPLGTWRVTSNILMPNFRWDKSVLETGVRSNNAHNLPPGPNSPVGIVWMGINRPSLGMHGTNSPDRIGRNESSGCIRLANWDAFRLCQLVGKGTSLEVR
jgi:lipoprotein-anchoring transpeptidase ErfK/SrfK